MGFWSKLGSVATGGLFDLGTSVLNNYYAKKENKKAYERNLAMWNMENEYNHPVQQMARLREAGLNPNMVYGSGATTLAASTKSAQPANVSFPQLDFLGMMNAYQDIEQKDATTENIKVQRGLIRQQEREARLRADIAQHNLSLVDGTTLFVGEGGKVSQVQRMLAKDSPSSAALDELRNGKGKVVVDGKGKPIFSVRHNRYLTEGDLAI